MNRPLLFDFYSCEGGAAKGYMDAGFEVWGFDDKPQPRYAGDRFFMVDVFAVPDWVLALADAFHASPPCQFVTALNNDKSRHLNLIPQTRALLQRTGKPYVIENVEKARNHLINPVALTGTMFDMHMFTSAGQRFDLERTRLFETNWDLTAPWDPGAQHPIANVFGGHVRCRSGEYRTGGGTGKTVDFPGEDRQALARELMQMPWATMGGISEAVPPPFTEHIGEQLFRRLAA